MRAVLAVGLVVIACGGPQHSDTLVEQQLQASDLTAASWSVENEVVLCPGATARYEGDNATNEVREPGAGNLVVCIWLCATYDGMFGGREVKANGHSLHLEFLRSDDGSWIAIQQSAGQGSCRPTEEPPTEIPTQLPNG